MTAAPDGGATLVAAVDNGFELVRLLELLGDRCTRAGVWKWHVILLTVDWPDPMLLGADLGRLWMQRVGTGEPLHGVSAGELLATRYAIAPTVRPDGPIWRFEPMSSAPLAERFTPVSKPQQRVRVGRAVVEAAAELRRFEAAHQAVVARLPGAPAWQTCAICSPLEEAAFGAPLPDEYTEVPVRQSYLTILGAPTFRDNVDRGWCVKRCPSCRTHYLWQSDYEYLVNGGTEDERTLTRLTDDQAAPWLERVEEAVAAAEAASRS